MFWYGINLKFKLYLLEFFWLAPRKKTTLFSLVWLIKYCFPLERFYSSFEFKQIWTFSFCFDIESVRYQKLYEYYRRTLMMPSFLVTQNFFFFVFFIHKQSFPLEMFLSYLSISFFYTFRSELGQFSIRYRTSSGTDP